MTIASASGDLSMEVCPTADSDAPLAIVHAADASSARRAAEAVRAAYRLGSPRDVEDRPVVVERIAPSL
jgi:thymidine phosphorylase